MPKLMVIRIIMSLGAVLLSTAPISQTFAQAQQQEAQAAVADTLSNSSAESDNLQLLRPGATAIFPVADSIPVADAAAAMPSAVMSTGGWVVIGVLIAVVVVVGAIYLLNCAGESAC